jgi:ribulose-phosphate 3-epimerase
MKPIRIAPSLLASDFSRLRDEIQRVEAGGADWLHLDVMDGHFVPNLTIGPALVESVRKVTKLPLDCHLMVLEPERFVPVFADAGADSLTFQAEAVAKAGASSWNGRGFVLPRGGPESHDPRRLEAVMGAARSRKKGLGVAINPDTPASVLDYIDRVDLVLAMTVWPGFGGQKFIESVVPKIGELRRMSADVDLEVDGGLDRETIRRAAGAGANVIVAGTSTFRAPDAAAAIRELRRNAEGTHGV